MVQLWTTHTQGTEFPFPKKRERKTMKPSLYIDGVPAADVAKLAIARGYFHLPRAGALHPLTPEGRAQMRHDTDLAAAQVLKDERDALHAARCSHQPVSKIVAKPVDT
jgi:hypothetical protein